MKDCIKVQHTLLTDVLLLLPTHEWEKAEMTILFVPLIIMQQRRWLRLLSIAFIVCFEVPLVKAGIDPHLIKAEWTDLTEYGKQYLNL